MIKDGPWGPQGLARGKGERGAKRKRKSEEKGKRRGREREGVEGRQRKCQV